MRGKIIDLRLRPPMEGYRIQFPLAMAGKNPGADRPVTSWLKSCEENKARMDLLYKEMDEAGIRLGVMHGRHVYHFQSGPDGVPMRTGDEDMAKVVEESNGRLIAFCGTDLARPMDEILSGIDKAINKMGMVGVNVEPGHTPTPMFCDNEIFTPIYEKCIQLDVPVMFGGGIYGGTIHHNDPGHFEKIAFKFPKLKILLAHSCYPYITQVFTLAFKCWNVYLSPDIYMFFPGRSIFLEAIPLLPSQFLFGTAYPLGELTSSVENTLKFPFTTKVMEKYLYRNAERLLKL